MKKTLNNCSEVYKLPYYWTSTRISSYLMGCYYNYFPEVGAFYNYNLNPDFEKENTRIITKVHMHYYRDTRRYWRLASVWYIDEEGNEVPFMVIQNAGREGDDYSTRIISNKYTFLEAANYFRDLILNSANIEQFIKNEIKKELITKILMTNEEEYNDIDTYIDDGNVMSYTREHWGYVNGESKYNINDGLGYFYSQDYFDTLNGNIDPEEYGPNSHIVIMKEEVDY